MLGLKADEGLINMDHVAIMKKSWKLTDKILSGQKKIESRWYKSKHAPWNQIKPGETIYFKDSGEPVTIKAEVEKVLQFQSLNPGGIKQILNQYGKAIGLGIKDIPKFFELFKNKKYCLLVFLKNPQQINPFDIDKKGFGNMAAWICVDSVNKIKKK
jgi:ASC-1-like (ASCH) protein